MTFYNTGSHRLFLPRHFSEAAAQTVQLTAPTTGGLARILYFQDRGLSSFPGGRFPYPEGHSSFFTGRPCFFPTSTP